MNAVLLLGWLVIIVFAALCIISFLPETSRKRKQVDPPLAPGAAMTVEKGQPSTPVVVTQPPRSGRDGTAGGVGDHRELVSPHECFATILPVGKVVPYAGQK